MTENELREKLFLKEGELINTNRGAMDIFSVENDIVTYGFVAGGKPMTESIESFLAHFVIYKTD
jgi:hypothetical protein